MKVTFLGTGTSMGVPVAGGFTAKKLGPDPRNQRWRTSAWIETEETSIIIDTSPEFRLQTIRAGIKRIDLVLITHEHMDHTAGLDDLRIFNYVQETSIPLYTSPQVEQAIKQRFAYMFGPDRYPGAVSVDINHIKQPVHFKDCTITPLDVNHGNINILGYRINDFSYITDAKRLPDETKAKVKGSTAMVLSGLRWGPEHPTHLTIPEAAELVRELKVPTAYLVHMNSHVNHLETNRRLAEEYSDINIALAYDQLTLKI